MNDLNQNDIIDSINSNKKKFLTYNAIKLQKLYSSISNQNIITLFDFIPFLLHLNEPDLPGYVESEIIPKGIYNYRATTNALKFIPTKYQNPALYKIMDKPFVQMFALMGSGGTIAFTEHSDFDFWICADTSSYEWEAIYQFKDKCRKIEEWITEKFNVEVHFFLNDIEKVKKNIFDEDEEEGLTGTSLGILLKEEFFRSSIVIAGKIPFWWTTPPGCPDEMYQQWLNIARADNFADFIDIGNLTSVLLEDFLIAALFQIIKSLGNPFKSIIKLGLLERYLNNINSNPFISNMIKKNVHEGKTSPEDIDAYLIMFNYVNDYLEKSAKDKIATELIKTCFYLKVDPKLSQKHVSEIEGVIEKKKKMQDYTTKWNWPTSTIGKMDDFDSWDIESVKNLLTNIKKYILKGYKDILGNLNSLNILNRYTSSRLEGITNKIYSHFSPAPNKIDNTLSLKSYPSEKLLTIDFIRDKEAKEFWVLQKRLIVNKYATKLIIHKNTSLFSVLVWISLNGLYQKDFTRLEIAQGLHNADSNFLKDLMTELSQHFSLKQVQMQNSYFFKQPFPVISYIIINPFSRYAQKIEDIYFLYHNSWGETKFDIHKTEIDIATILSKVLSGGLFTQIPFERAIHTSSSYPYNTNKDYLRLRRLIKDIYDFFVTVKAREKKRYITILANQYVVFTNMRKQNEEIITAKTYNNELQLLYSISYNRGLKTLTKTDPSIAELNYIKTIINNFKENIQIYFQVEKKYCYYFISDERGGITFFRKPSQDHISYLARLADFANNLVNIILENNPDSPLVEIDTKVEFYSMERDLQHNCSIKPFYPEKDVYIVDINKSKKPFKLAIHLQDNGEIGYRFSLPDSGYSEVFYFQEMNQIAKELKVLMESVKGYIYYVSDISLENAGLSLYKNYSSLAFSEKNRFELFIERGLQLS